MQGSRRGSGEHFCSGSLIQTCYWAATISQVLSLLPKIQQRVGRHTPCPWGISSLSAIFLRGLVKNAGQCPLNQSSWVRPTSPGHLYPDKNEDIRSFPTTHLRKGKRVRFCSWCGGVMGMKQGVRRAQHLPPSELHLLHNLACELARPRVFCCTLMLLWISVGVDSF